MAEVQHCLCDVPVKIYTSKDGDKMAQCGIDVEKKAIFADTKGMKRDEKDAYLDRQELGCKLNMAYKDLKYLPNAIFKFPPKYHPKCDGHQMFCRINISKANGENFCRPFFACAANFPDIGCGTFEWADTDKITKLIESTYLSSLYKGNVAAAGAQQTRPSWRQIAVSVPPKLKKPKHADEPAEYVDDDDDEEEDSVKRPKPKRKLTAK